MASAETLAAKKLPTEKLEERVATLEKRMQRAADDGDYDDAATLKHRIEPLKEELAVRALASQQALDAAAAEAERRALVVTDDDLSSVVDHFSKPSAHDRHTLSNIHHDKPSSHDRQLIPVQHNAPSTHDKELIGVVASKPSAHDKELIGVASKPSAHDRHIIDIPKTSSQHDRQLIAVADKKSSHDKQAIAIATSKSAHDQHMINIAKKSSTKDREMIAVATSKSSHDKEAVAIAMSKSAHDQHLLNFAKTSSLKDRELIATHINASRTDKELIKQYSKPTAEDLHMLHKPKPPPEPKKPPPPKVRDPDLEAAKEAAESNQEALVSAALAAHSEFHPKAALREPPAHPCRCGTPRATCIFIILLQGAIVPLALIIIAITTARLEPLDSKGSSDASNTAWWPYLLTVPAFLDFAFTAIVIARERGPGGSLEYQLFPCNKGRPPEPGAAAPSVPATVLPG